jgi:hypothetical protein
MSQEQEQDVVIYDSSLTLEQLKGLWAYMEDDDDKPVAKFTKEEIEKLGDDIDDAIHNVIEDFLNHRGN